MEERFSRVENNTDLYIENDHKSDIIDILLYSLMIAIFILLIMFTSIIDVKAETISVNLTSNGVSAGQNCINHPLNAFCTSQMVQGSSTNACGNGDAKCSMYMAYGTENNVYSLNFVANTSFHANSKVTITLKGPYFANATYGCSTNVGTANNLGCRAIRTSSTSMNINFTTNSNPLTYADFDVYINTGNGFNPNRFFNITSIVLYETPIEDSSGSSSFDDSGIINNANQNTSDIIQNQDSNTEEIKTTIFDNVKSIIKELANLCNNLVDFDWLQRGVLNNNDGSIVDNGGSIDNINKENGSFTFTNNGDWSGFTYNRYLDVSNYDLYLNFTSSSLNNTLIKVVAYDSNFNRIANKEYWRVSNVPLCTSSITGICNASNVKYVRFSIETYETTSFNISYLRVNNNNNQYCPFGSTTSKLDDIGGILGGIGDNINTTNDKIDDVNDTLTDDNIDSGVGSNFFNDFSTSNPGGISSIVTKPLTIINNLLSNNSNCNNLALPNIMGVQNASLPSGCIFWNNVDNNIVSLWNIFVCGLGSYYILKSLFHLVEDLKNPDKDKVEVLDL